MESHTRICEGFEDINVIMVLLLAIGGLLLSTEVLLLSIEVLLLSIELLLHSIEVHICAIADLYIDSFQQPYQKLLKVPVHCFKPYLRLHSLLIEEYLIFQILKF